MESRFGRDFGAVTLHTDSAAARSARDVQAKAYTVGNHVVFAAGQYNPGGEPGRRLLAHELAHTVQQRGLQAQSEVPLDLTHTGQALERDADRAADAALRGAPVPSMGVPSTGIIARQADEHPPPAPTDGWRDLPQGDPRRATGIRQEAGPIGGPNGLMAYRVESFPLPKSKGPIAAQVYDNVIQAGALRAVIRMNGARARRPELSQARASTVDLRANWLRKVGWTTANAQSNWERRGGAAARANVSAQPFDPVVGADKRVCHLDHIVELQLGGTNVDANIQVLDAGPNMLSGRMISEHLGDVAEAAYAGAPAAAKPGEILLQFLARAPGTDQPIPCEGSCTPPPSSATCCQIERCAPAAIATASAPGAAIYQVKAGGVPADIEANPAGGRDTQLDSSDIPRNANAAELISGMKLERLKRPANGQDHIKAKFDQGKLPTRSRETRIPLALKQSALNEKLTFDVDPQPPHLLRLRPSEHPEIAFIYPYLSEGRLNLAYDPESGFSGRGTLTPSLPLLRSAPLILTMDPDRLRLSLEVPPERLRTPIPNFRLTQAALIADLLPAFHPEGVLAFEIGPVGRPVATGRISITADTNGLVLEGTLDAHIPRVDRAQGRVSYRGGHWSGGIEINSTQIGIPGIQSGALSVAFTDDGVTVTGTVVAAIPGGHTVTFRAERTPSGRIEFRGDATLHIPGLRPVDAQIRYDGITFRGHARTGVDLGPLSGEVSLDYEANSETGVNRLSGEGTLGINRGRVNGTFHGRVRDGVLTGDGRVQVRLTDNLIGQVGITLNEHRLLHVSGDLVVPNPIQLFPRVPREGGQREFFNRSLDIPIVGITLGPLGAIGLIARVTAGFGVRYHFGPGTLENIRLGVALNPLEEDTAFTADGHAELNIPAYAGAYLRLRGALGLSAAIASVTGGIEALAELGLEGGARTAVDLHYAQGGFALEGTTRILVNPVFHLNLAANVIAEVGALGLTQQWRKDWQLYAFELGSGWQIGLEVGVGYDSRTGVRLPSVDQIHWIYPQDINARQILQNAFQQAARAG